MIKIWDQKGEWTFKGDHDNRLDLNICKSGYLTVYEASSCIYKNSLSEIVTVYVSTPLGLVKFKPKSLLKEGVK